MKISELFELNKTQHELDFVDIDVSKDKPVFIDPFFISTRNDPWCEGASRTIKSFFQLIIDLIRQNDEDSARQMFINLNEPNETCLGVSSGKPKGRGVDDFQADQIFESILESKAVQSGVVEDLEDTAIFIHGIGRDKVSDMTTNIIRKHLLDYTINQCNLLGIPLTQDVPSGYYWDTALREWRTEYTHRLVVNTKPLLLVPKIAVSFYKDYVDKKYHQHFVLNFLQEQHLAKKSGLVIRRTLKDGTVKEYVTKKDVKEHEAPFSKEYLRAFTKKHPEVFEKFRRSTSNSVVPMRNQDLDEIDVHELLQHLISQFTAIRAGSEDASKFHNLIIGVLELIFYPNLTNPVKEKPINDGRKRIDITFDNSANTGFFQNLHKIQQIVSRYIFVECKNYSEDPSNPELDQLSGRFSVNSSKAGILVCRSVANKPLMVQRCIDLWKQKNELIVVLSDEEIVGILEGLKNGNNHPEEKILLDLQRSIIVS